MGIAFLLCGSVILTMTVETTAMRRTAPQQVTHEYLGLALH